MRIRIPLLLGLVAIAFCPPVSADATAPVQKGSKAAVQPWGDYCFARFESARGELVRRTARFRDWSVVHVRSAGVPDAIVFRSNRKEEVAPETGETSASVSRSALLQSQTWEDKLATGGVLTRGENGYLAIISDSDGAGENFVSLFRRAADDCLSAGDVSAAPHLSLAGRWHFDGGITYDNCAGELELKTGDFTISPDEKTLHSERLDRTYNLHVEDGMLIVENTFPDHDCPGLTFYERWVLVPSANRTLKGHLATTWNRNPRCGSKRCDVDFFINAKR